MNHLLRGSRLPTVPRINIKNVRISQLKRVSKRLPVIRPLFVWIKTEGDEVGLWAPLLWFFPRTVVTLTLPRKPVRHAADLPTSRRVRELVERCQWQTWRRFGLGVASIAGLIPPHGTWTRARRRPKRQRESTGRSTATITADVVLLVRESAMDRPKVRAWGEFFGYIACDRRPGDVTRPIGVLSGFCFAFRRFRTGYGGKGPLTGAFSRLIDQFWTCVNIEMRRGSGWVFIYFRTYLSYMIG